MTLPAVIASTSLLRLAEPRLAWLICPVDYWVPLAPSLISWLPLLIAATATAIVLAVSSVVSRNQSASMKDKSPFRSKQ